MKDLSAISLTQGKYEGSFNYNSGLRVIVKDFSALTFDNILLITNNKRYLSFLITKIK